MSDLCDLTALELQTSIAKKAISPVDLWNACVARIKTTNTALNAVVTLDEDAGRKAAKEAEAKVVRGDPLGPLHGLPIGIKDLNETKGLRTTWGSELFADHIPVRDDTLVTSIRANGGIIAIKTNTPEFGAGANTWNRVFGATGNPFNTSLTCGGSSGGSAVALAASMVPLASGSDLAGSLRTPAAFCGVVGMRPTPGLVPTTDSVLAFSPLAVEGPMARNVRDLHLFLQAIAGNNHLDPFSRPADSGAGIAELKPANLRGLKVRFSADLGFAPVSNNVRALFGTRIAALEGCFASLEERDPPMQGADETFQVLRAVRFIAAHLDRVRNHAAKVGPNVTSNVELGLTFDAEQIARAEAAHSDHYRRFIRFMDDCDLLITPVAAVQPFDKTQNAPTEIDGQALQNYVSWLGLAFGITMTAHPVISLPCGHDSQGLPFGLQLVGKRHGDQRLLEIALALEDVLASSIETRRPLVDFAGLAG
ncbi:amidase family protein [Limibacillus sp. MBR-115]|jgi:Asp-tRNA(Asn)/Glu-tRNA(Gln) amidotransferase A subunit family amidase|uniref:amidase n=1 Tax=Limibacillus sp. MBR-115 TaxID=3156465 RepID=UPI00339A8107